MEKFGIISVVLLNITRPMFVLLQDIRGVNDPIALLIKGGESFSIVGLLSFIIYYLYKKNQKLEEQSKELEEEIREGLRKEIEDLKR